MKVTIIIFSVAIFPLLTKASPATAGGLARSNNRIVNGEPAGDVIPWQVALVKTGQDDPGCGGTIICPKFILTAAHCVGDDPSSSFQVLVGEYDWSDGNADGSMVRHDVKNIHNHDKYDTFTKDFDFSLLEMKEPINMGGESKASPACLPDPEDNVFNEHTRFELSGWGALDYIDIFPDKLQRTSVEYCSSANDATFCLGCPQGEPFKICTRANKGTGGCRGDSGGPLTWLDPLTSKVKLIGVVTGGDERMTANGNITCASNDPDHGANIFARVTSVLPWIDRITKNCAASNQDCGKNTKM